ncbi:hypothetical protein [Actinomycetospora chlora]|uniref:hypothetical protein n=1 Tax=Actinomycetospora chlora TaxID=663608 RepID=UPI0031E54912
MIVRSGRLLPSVIVGALLSGSLALGAGTASAADNDPCYVGLRQGVVQGDDCVTTDGTLLGTLAQATLGRLATVVEPSAPATQPATSTGTGSGSSSTGGVGSALDGVTGPLTGTTGTATGTTGSTGGGTATGTTGNATTGNTTTDPAANTAPPAGPAVLPAAPPVLPAPDVRGVPAAFASAPGGLAARLPMLGFGPSLNPALLNVPLSPPLRTLVGQNQASPVTTTSDVQAMAFDGSGGLGTPAIIGVLILAGLGGFALRHRVLRRVRTGARG